MTIDNFLSQIENTQHQNKVRELFTWMDKHFPNLEYKYAWNQPMFCDHGTFIIGFALSKAHIAISPEKAGMFMFCEDIKQSGYSQSKMLFRIKWEEPFDFTLLENIIHYNIKDKKECTTFWRS